MHTGRGDDRLVARPRNGDPCAVGRFRGGPGDDALGAGSYGTVWGGTGADRLSGGTVHPGPGDDTVEYAWLLTYGKALHRVRLDLLRNVAVAEGVDRILVDPMEVYGSPFKDVLRGGEGPDMLGGGPRGDIIYGRAGADEIFESVVGRGLDIAYGGPDGAYCLGIEERHNCPVWND